MDKIEQMGWTINVPDASEEATPTCARGGWVLTYQHGWLTWLRDDPGPSDNFPPVIPLQVMEIFILMVRDWKNKLVPV